ncbi:MAG: hypothetical protein VX642_13755 [Bdellovibrionota bacterium]|nr:hypothetical protein [Bdellovibrionota bacterium]
MKNILLSITACLAFAGSLSANEANSTNIQLLDSINPMAEAEISIGLNLDFSAMTLDSQNLSKTKLSINSDKIGSVRNPRIRRVLQREMSATKVNEAMNIKRSGLRHVESFRDFHDLVLVPFNNPTNAYKDARGDFILAHVDSFLHLGFDPRLITSMELDLRIVSDVIALKRKAIPMVYNLFEYNSLMELEFNSPSDTMKQALNDLIGSTIMDVPSSERMSVEDIEYLGSELERKTKKINASLVVKRALYKNVRNLRQFYAASLIYLSSPTDAYKEQNGEQISKEIAYHVRPRSSIRNILRIEGLTKKVNQAIAVKQAGLAAAGTPDRFWHLTEYAFRNPSNAYRNAVSRFIDRYADGYGK